MTVRECVVRGPIASEHIVQFFDSDESRSECVAKFLAEGYRQGEPAIVVARAANWASACAQLGALGVPVQQAMTDGMFVVKDADDTFSTRGFMCVDAILPQPEAPRRIAPRASRLEAVILN